MNNFHFLKKMLIYHVIIIVFIGFIFSSSIGDVLFEKNFKSVNIGNTLYVGGDGPGNYSRIQDAIDDAEDGDTVFVFDYSSPYYENIVVNKSIFLIGENKETTIIDSEKKGNVVFLLDDGITIRDFTLTRGGQRGIRIWSNNNNISNCNLVDNRRGIVIFLGKGNIISNCFFGGNGIGIYLQGWDEYVTDTIISHCTFAGDGIWLYKAQNNLINDCKFIGGYTVIRFDNGADYNSIVNCTLESIKTDAIGITSGGNIFENCIINNTELYAFRIDGAYGAQQTKILNCQITNSGVTGILFWGNSEDSIISGCNLSNNKEGIAFFGGIYNTEVSECNIVNNECGIVMFAGSFFNRFFKNNFINNFEDIDTNPPGSSLLFMFNFYKNNYWDDWRGSGPYHVYGLLNWDFYPMNEPYKYIFNSIHEKNNDNYYH